jgi:ankyrin repeat protein
MATRVYQETSVSGEFDKLMHTAMVKSCRSLEDGIREWFLNPGVTGMNLDKASAILPVELSNRLLAHVSLRSYSDTSRKIDLLVNKHGANVNALSAQSPLYGSSMLSIAIGSRRDDAALALLKLGTNPLLPMGPRGQHPLIDVAFKGDPRVLESMYERGADMTITNAWGNTVLMAAITGGHLETVRFLLEVVKVDPNITGGSVLNVTGASTTDVPHFYDVSYNIRPDGAWSPMHAAVHLKNPVSVKMIELLLAAGANVHAHTEKPYTALGGNILGGYTPLELLTIHAKIDGTVLAHHDRDAMLECENLLEGVVASTSSE